MLVGRKKLESAGESTFQERTAFTNVLPPDARYCKLFSWQYSSLLTDHIQLLDLSTIISTPPNQGHVSWSKATQAPNSPLFWLNIFRPTRIKKHQTRLLEMKLGLLLVQLFCKIGDVEDLLETGHDCLEHCRMCHPQWGSR
jgi:hypothetical protein